MASGVDRRTLFRLGALAGAGASMAGAGMLAGSPARAQGAGDPGEEATPEEIQAAVAAAPSELNEATIAELQSMMSKRHLSSTELVEYYLARIRALDKRGPKVNSILEVNPDAINIAMALDKERHTKGPRGPLHGIPVILKDNIDTADKLHTTAGSFALLGPAPPQDATVAARLRAAGAVILGKAGLSEWANFRSTHSSSGWSGRGGQVHNPYYLDRNPSGSSSGSGSSTSSNFTTFGGSIPTGVWYWTPAQLAAYDGPGFTQRDPIQRAYPPYWFELKEKDTAAYVQADFKGEAWSANVGLRYVRTTEDTVTWVPLACSASIPPSANPCPANTPGLVVGSLFGAYAGVPVDKTYNDVLPSANLKLDLTKDLVGRLAVAQTMTRADYSALASSTSLTPPANYPGTGSGTGSNPLLKPIRSTNYDAGLEWYFAPRSLLGATLFYMDLRNYIGYGTETLSYPTSGSAAAGFPPGIVQVPYLLTVPINTQGRAQGVEFTYQQAFGQFGIDANYTFTDAKQSSDVPPGGDNRLVGASKNTYNISGYYENAHFSARVSYNYRSAFYSGLDRSTAFSQDSIGTLAASLAWLVNENLSVNLDGQNLNDPTLKYYALNTTQPRAFYKNGRQYYLSVRAKF